VKRLAIAFAIITLLAPPAAAQSGTGMPDLRQISGQPLPAPDLPAGTISVRVVRGGFDKNLAGQSVEFTIDGKTRLETTDANGRCEVSGLKPGARVIATVNVDGERLTTQEITVGSTGIKILLAATDPEATKRAEDDRRLAAGPAVKGSVVFGSQSRVIAEFNQDRLNVFYMLEIVNTARTPVDIGGPLLLDLPREARGAGLMSESTKQATVKGARVTVVGPFAPGTTTLQVGFELPFSGDTAHLKQVWPVTLQTLNLIVGQSGGIDFRSPQVTNRRNVSTQGLPAISAVGPAIAAGQPLELEISGLPHHARWPRYVALSLSGVIMAVGIWAAIFPSPRRRVA
jgi:hypothetical protein